MQKYYPTIGLEIHVELGTASKMFCGCKNDPEGKQASYGTGPEIEKPNTNICPVCMAHPGAIPVPNKKAIESVVKVGLAIGGEIADFSEFDRKSYFYPDIPKGYQISQYKYPIVKGGEIEGVKITRVHLEEDTATSSHVGPESSSGQSASLIDFNRAGVPLMELVTEPVIHEPELVGRFGRELQLILRSLGVSEANMERGQMRVEVNVSVSPDESKLGTLVEVKNINSFRSAVRAAEFEIARMSALWDEGKQDEILRETRGWDENKQKTFSQRSKEVADEYRYFPDGDIPKLKLHELFDIEELRKNLPELPSATRARLVDLYGIKQEDAEIYVADKNLLSFFEEVVAQFSSPSLSKIASNYITSDMMGLFNTLEGSKLPDSKSFASLIEMVDAGELSSRGVKDILPVLMTEGGDPKVIAKDRGLIQENDEGALKIIVQKIIDENPEVVATYKGGKENAIMSLVGKVMKESGGSANPALVTKLLKEMV
jgi:aspartyl-tRNA(Asn)/glutamyl-tRNA(Gln) amidotransferase subunit B